MQCLINQPAGLGDIFVCQKIVDLFIDNGYKVVWPVVEQYYDTANRHMKKKGLSFCHIDDDFPLKEYFTSGLTVPKQLPDGNAYLPLRYADLHFPNQCVMRAKYKILNLNHRGWQKHFVFSRDIKKEQELFHDVLGLKEKSRYVLVNKKYATPPHVLEKKIDVNTDLKVVEVDFYSDFTVFDWCKVLELATEIYSVDTCFFFLIDTLKIKATRLDAYSRHNPASFLHVDGLFQAPWKYVY